MKRGKFLRNSGRDRDRTDDLYRVKVALIPTELRARETNRQDCTGRRKSLSTAPLHPACLRNSARRKNCVGTLEQFGRWLRNVQKLSRILR